MTKVAVLTVKLLPHVQVNRKLKVKLTSLWSFAKSITQVISSLSLSLRFYFRFSLFLSLPNFFNVAAKLSLWVLKCHWILFQFLFPFSASPSLCSIESSRSRIVQLTHRGNLCKRHQTQVVENEVKFFSFPLKCGHFKMENPAKHTSGQVCVCDQLK